MTSNTTIITEENTVSRCANDIRNSHNLASLRLGQFVNEIRFRMEALWLIGYSSESFPETAIPWVSLVLEIESLGADRPTKELCKAKVEQARSAWRDLYRSEWHADSMLDHGLICDGRREISTCSNREFLRLLNPPITDVVNFLNRGDITSKEFFDLGIAVSQSRFPPDTAIYVTDLMPSVPDVGAIEAQHNTRVVDAMLAQLGIEMSGDEIREASRRPEAIHATYLGLQLNAGTVRRASLPPVQLQHQQSLILSHFIERKTRRTTIEELCEDWYLFSNRIDTTQEAEAKTVRRAVQKLSRALFPLGVEICCPVKGSGYVLRLTGS